MQFHGIELNGTELRRRTGRSGQVAGVTRYELQDGPERGVEMLHVRTGSGFEFGVCPSRGMDITFAEHNGRSIAWQSSTGWAHPHTFSESNLGWLRGFGGGLLTTCGLQSFGPDCEDEGEKFGIHDRISFTPAERVQVSQLWLSEERFQISVSGTVRQTRVFGPNLRLERSITTQLGANWLKVQDTIVNDAFAPEPLCVLYHCNFGWPVVSETSRVEITPASTCTPRDEMAQRGFDNWNKLEAPQDNFAEQVFFHQVAPDENGQVQAQIWNEKINFGGYVKYSTDNLPNFTQWKMMGAGNYVCGLEPSNAPLASRAQLKERGQLPMIMSGDAKTFRLELGVLDSESKL